MCWSCVASLGGMASECGDPCLPTQPEWLSNGHLVQGGKWGGRAAYLSDTSTSCLVCLGHHLVMVSWEVAPSWCSFLCARFEDAAGEHKSRCWAGASRSFPALLQYRRALTIELTAGLRLGAQSIKCVEIFLLLFGQGRGGAFIAGKVSLVTTPTPWSKWDLKRSHGSVVGT